MAGAVADVNRGWKGTLVGASQKKKLFITKISDKELPINVRVANACPVKIIKVQ